ATDVVVPLEVAAVVIVALALVPVARRIHIVNQAAVVQHRQVEAAAVPGDDLRRVFLDAVEEALDDLAFRQLRLRQRPDAEAFVAAHGAGNRGDALQMMRQEIAAVLRAPLLEDVLGDLAVRQLVRQVVQRAYALDVGNGFNIENKDWGHKIKILHHEDTKNMKSQKGKNRVLVPRSRPRGMRLY